MRLEQTTNTLNVALVLILTFLFSFVFLNTTFRELGVNWVFGEGVRIKSHRHLSVIEGEKEQMQTAECQNGLFRASQKYTFPTCCESKLLSFRKTNQKLRDKYDLAVCYQSTGILI